MPTCPGWTFRQLDIHLGRGHRRVAQIVATRAVTPIPMRDVADGKLPQDPAQHTPWLNAGADRAIEAVTAAGSDLVWTLAASARPASGHAARPTRPPCTWLTLSSRPDDPSIWTRRLPRTVSTNGSPAPGAPGQHDEPGEAGHDGDDPGAADGLTEHQGGQDDDQRRL